MLTTKTSRTLISTTQARTRSQTPSCRAGIWTKTSYSIQSIIHSKKTLTRKNDTNTNVHHTRICPTESLKHVMCHRNQTGNTGAAWVIDVHIWTCIRPALQFIATKGLFDTIYTLMVSPCNATVLKFPKDIQICKKGSERNWHNNQGCSKEVLR